MQRRSFLAGLAGCLAAGYAPAAVNSKILMPVKEIVQFKEIPKAQILTLGELFVTETTVKDLLAHQAIVPSGFPGGWLSKDLNLVFWDNTSDLWKRYNTN